MLLKYFDHIQDIEDTRKEDGDDNNNVDEHHLASDLEIMYKFKQALHRPPCFFKSVIVRITSAIANNY